MQLCYCSSDNPLLVETGMAEISADFVQSKCHFRKLMIGSISADTIHSVTTFRTNNIAHSLSFDDAKICRQPDENVKPMYSLH
jgi:hypothetical protein